MENASKALLIAGGVLLGMLLISLLFYTVGIFKNYQGSKDELINIENTSKFNQKFTAYDRKDVQGYELITLVNQTVDYNERKTIDSKYGNDNQYPFITLIIDLNSMADRFLRDDSINVDYRLFRENIYQDDESSSNFSANKRSGRYSSFEKNINDKLKTALTNFNIENDEVRANKVAKNIGSIFLTQNEVKSKASLTTYGSEQAVYQDMANTYNMAVNPDTKVTWEDAKRDFIIGNNNAERNKYYVYACMFYEYMQFKRGVFECTNLQYDNLSGRVNKIEFKFTGNIH